MDYGLKKETIEKLNSVFIQFPEIDAAILYGSRAKGNYRIGSDIDLTLKGEKLTNSALNSISIKIDDLLLPYMVDISILTQISNPDLVEHIERVGKVFYERSKATPALSSL